MQKSGTVATIDIEDRERLFEMGYSVEPRMLKIRSDDGGIENKHCGFVVGQIEGVRRKFAGPMFSWQPFPSSVNPPFETDDEAWHQLHEFVVQKAEQDRLRREQELARVDHVAVVGPMKTAPDGAGDIRVELKLSGDAAVGIHQLQAGLQATGARGNTPADAVRWVLEQLVEQREWCSGGGS